MIIQVYPKVYLKLSRHMTQEQRRFREAVDQLYIQNYLECLHILTHKMDQNLFWFWWKRQTIRTLAVMELEHKCEKLNRLKNSLVPVHPKLPRF